MEWFFELLDPDEWSAIAAVVATVAGIAAAVFAGTQLWEARRIRREQAAPYVVARLDHSEASHKLLDLVIKNYGATTAHDVHLQFDPEVVRSDEDAHPEFAFMRSKAIADGIKMLVPGQEIRLYFDFLPDRDKAEMPSEFVVRVNARDSRGRRVPEGVFDLDASWNKDALNVVVHSTHWIGQRIEGIEKELRKLVTASAFAGRRKATPVSSTDLESIATSLEVLAKGNPRRGLPRGRGH